jgi:hypothetical protein
MITLINSTYYLPFTFQNSNGDTMVANSGYVNLTSGANYYFPTSPQPNIGDMYSIQGNNAVFSIGLGGPGQIINWKTSTGTAISTTDTYGAITCVCSSSFPGDVVFSVLSTNGDTFMFS